MDSTRELVMIHDELLVVQGFTVDGEDAYFMLRELFKH